MINPSTFRRTTIITSWLWLFIFAIIPVSLVVAISFMQYSPSELYQLPLTLHHYRQLINLDYLAVFAHSIKYASICTAICLAISYPFAYSIAMATHRFKHILLLLVIIPFWTSSLIRTYAIMAILKTKGLLNMVLIKLGLIEQPLQWLYTNVATMAGLVYTLLPFMILPLYANIEKLDTTLLDAARDLGANRYTIFKRVVLPLTLPGILSGILMVFLPAMTLFYIPALLGGSRSLLLGNLISMQYLTANNWPMGSATSVLLIALMLLMLSYYWRHTKKSDRDHLL